MQNSAGCVGGFSSSVVDHYTRSSVLA